MKQSLATGVILLVAVFVFATTACGTPEERKAAYRMRAEAYMQEGNIPKARVALRNVLKIDPKDADAYFLFAQVEEKEHNWRNAFANYQRVVELAPEHEKAHVRMAKFYLEARMLEKVSEIADKVLAHHPGSVKARTLLIAVDAVNGQLDDATKRSEALVAEHPTDGDAVMMFASLLLTQGRGAEAEQALQRVLDAEPKNTEVLNGLGSVYVRTGQPALADGVYR